jgi:hypothetical protein
MLPIAGSNLEVKPGDVVASMREGRLEKLDRDLSGALLYTNDSIGKESSSHDQETEKEPRSSIQGKGGS